MRRNEITYTIEDLDAIEPGTSSEKENGSYEEAQASGSKDRPDLRKHYSADSRYSSYLSPDDALWNLRRHANTGTEFRWELHTSKTDVDLARKGRCSCHDVTPEKKQPERGDLRKHHSAETDKWSLRADCSHELRKHSSDDSRMAREVGWTLQVPEALPNPNPRCTCPKTKVLSTSSISDASTSENLVTTIEVEKKLRYSKSLTPEEMSPSITTTTKLKKHASEDSKLAKKIEKADSRASKKEKAVIVGLVSSKKSLRSRWAMRAAHFSMPAERKDSKPSKSHEAKSKSLKERPKYSIRRSISPDPDPRQVMRLDNRVVRRLVSPEISLANAKWAPYEGYSPLPNVGIRKREPKRISEIKWTPCDKSPSEVSIVELGLELEPPEDEDKNPFENVTPTHHPPPQATPRRGDEDGEDRWRFLNQVSPFPIYQGAWRDESPPKTPPRDPTPRVWSPLKSAVTPIRIPKDPSPSPPKRRSIMKAVRKKTSRAKSESTRVTSFAGLTAVTEVESKSAARIPSRASSEEPKSRQRPQLLRSKALLEVPAGIDPTKRSMSEEVPKYRSTHQSSRVPPHRAKSEEVSKYADPWFTSDSDAPELRQYVTTV